eukprot:scaffold168210_cov31-Attheya_sp.AAC.4
MKLWGTIWDWNYSSVPISNAQPTNQDDVANVEARVDKVEIELSHLIGSIDERAIKFAFMGFVVLKNRRLG